MMSAKYSQRANVIHAIKSSHFLVSALINQKFHGCVMKFSGNGHYQSISLEFKSC